MDLGDLSPEALAEAMPGREIRTYLGVLSTEADAMAWARTGAPEGAVVVANYQSSPRGRAGWAWQVAPGRSLGFSLVLRPELPADREGWLYTVAASGLADVLGEAATIEWPDEVRVEGERAGAVSVRVSVGMTGFLWAVVSVLVVEAPPPRPPLLRRVVEGIERRYAAEPEAVLADYLPRCETLGRSVRARLIGERRAQPPGRAVTARQDGALVVENPEGRRLAFRPQSLQRLDDAPPHDGEPGVDPAASP